MPQKHYKQVLYDSISSNKKLKNIIDEALKSPPGSSHRKYAKKLLQSISTSASKKFDGQGGSGSMISGSDPWAKYKLPEPSKRFHPLPPCPKRGNNPNHTREQRLAMSMEGAQGSMAGEKQDGQGGATGILPYIAEKGDQFGNWLGRTKLNPLNVVADPKFQAGVVGTANVAASLPFMVEGAGEYALGKTAQAFYKPEGAPDVKFDQTTGGSIASNIISPKTNPTMKWAVDQFSTQKQPQKKNPYAGTDMDKKLNEAFQRIQNGSASEDDKIHVQYATSRGWSSTSSNIPDIKTSQTANPNFAQSIIGDGAGLKEETSQKKTGQVQMSPDGKTYTYVNHDGTVHQGTVGDNYVDNTIAQGTQGSVDTINNTIDTSGTSVDGSTQDTGEYWVGQNIRNAFSYAAAEGFDENAAVQYAMSQPGVVEEIQKMFPNIDPKYFIGNKNVVEAIKDINAAIKTEMGLDDLLKEMNSMKSQQYGIKDTMVNYVKGRDEYYNKIDKMIDDATDKYLNRSDADNPAVQQQYKQYMDYLNGLKGRQYTRYANALNQSITSFNNKYQQLQDQYNTALDQYNEKIKIEDAIVTQDYEDIYNALQGVYSGAVAAITAASEEGDAWSALYGNALDGSSLGLKVDTAKDSGANYRKGIADVNDLFKNNPAGVIPSSVDLWDQFKTYASVGESTNTMVGFINGLKNVLTAELQNPPKESTEAGETEVDQINRIDSILNSWKTGMEKDQYQSFSDGDSTIQNKMQNLIDEVLAAEKPAYQRLTKGQGKKIKEALKMLEGGKTSGSLWWKKSEQFTPEEKSDFIKESGLTPDLAGLIFDTAMAAVQAGQPITSPFSGYSSMSDEQLEKFIADNLVEAKQSNF